MTTQYWVVSATGDWSNPADWQSGAVPASTDDAVVNNSNGVTVNGAASANSLTLNNSTVAVSGSLTLATTLTLDGYSILNMNGGAVFAQSIVASDLAWQRITGYGAVSGAFTGLVQAEASGGALKINGSGLDAGYINANSTLELSGNASNIDFSSNGTGTLKLDAPSAFTGAISGFALGDTIDLAGITAGSASYTGSTLTINETNGQTLTYNNFNAAVAGDVLALKSDGAGGTDVSWVAPPDVWKTGVAGDWSTASDWQSGAVPASSGDAVINNSSSVTVNGAASANSLTLNNSTVAVSGSLTLATTLTLDGYSILNMNGGAVSAQSIVASDLAWQRITGYGAVSGAFTGLVQAEASGGALKINGSGLDAGYINANSALELSGEVGQIHFDSNGTGTLKLDAPSAFTGAISGFALGDTIDLAGITAGSASYTGSTLTINETNGQTLTYNNFNAAVAGDVLALKSDGAGGTDLSFTQSAPTSETWTGAAGDYQWTSQLNWDGGVVPSASTNLTVSGGANTYAVIQGAQQAASLTETFDGASQSGTVELKGSLTLSGPLTLTNRTDFAIGATDFAIDGGAVLNASGGVNVGVADTLDFFANPGTVATINGNVAVASNALVAVDRQPCLQGQIGFDVELGRGIADGDRIGGRGRQYVRPLVGRSADRHDVIGTWHIA